MDALGHTLTPFCSVCRQFFGFIPSSVHVLQISSDDVHPVFPWPSRLSPVAPQFPLYSLTRYSGVLHSQHRQHVSQPPQFFLTMSSNFCTPVFLWSLHFSLCLSTWFLTVFVGTCRELLPVSITCVTGSGHNSAPYSGIEMTSDSYNLTFTGRLMLLLF